MSAWLQTFLLGAGFGLIIGFFLAALIVKVEARREARYRRPGYIHPHHHHIRTEFIPTHSNVSNVPPMPGRPMRSQRWPKP